MKRARSPSLCSILPGSPSVAKRTRAEKHRDKLVGRREGGGGEREKKEKKKMNERRENMHSGANDRT